jgi:hypothetical protein
VCQSSKGLGGNFKSLQTPASTAAAAAAGFFCKGVVNPWLQEAANGSWTHQCSALGMGIPMPKAEHGWAQLFGKI